METKSYNKAFIKTLMCIGFVGVILTILDLDINYRDFNSLVNDLGSNNINTMVIIGNLLYSVVFCIYLYCTMVKFKVEKIASPSQGIFIIAIIFELISVLTLLFTNNYQSVSEEAAILSLIFLLGYLVLMIVLAVGFCNSKHLALGILLILVPLIQFGVELWLPTTKFSELGFRIFVFAYVILEIAPLACFAQLLEEGKTD